MKIYIQFIPLLIIFFSLQTILVSAQTAEDFYHQASAFYDNGEYEKAITYYTEVIAQNKDYSNAYFNRGLARFNLAKYHQALFDFSYVIQISPNDVEAIEYRGKTRFLLADYIGAIDDYSKAISIDASSVLFANRGLARSILRKFGTALTDFKTAIEMNPNDGETYSNIGDVYFEMEAYEKAIQYYNQALQLNPNDELAYNNRANSFNKLKRPDEALADYTKAIEIQSNSEILANRGFFEVQHGLDQQAYADCSEALKQDKQNARAYSCVALVELRKGHYLAAIDYFDHGISLGDKSADSYNGRGMARHLGGYYQDAILDYNRAIVLELNHSDAYSNRGASKFMLGDFHGAIADQNTAIKLAPDNAVAYSRLETCYIAIQKLNQGQSTDALTIKGRKASFNFISNSNERLEWEKYKSFK